MEGCDATEMPQTAADPKCPSPPWKGSAPLETAPAMHFFAAPRDWEIGLLRQSRLIALSTHFHILSSVSKSYHFT